MIKANPAAFAFLSARRSRPAKLFHGPVPDHTALRAILTTALRVPDQTGRPIEIAQGGHEIFEVMTA